MMQAQTTDTLPPTTIVSIAPLSRQRKANSYFFGYDFPFTISFLTDENIFYPQQITMPILADKTMVNNNDILLQTNLLNFANELFVGSTPLAGEFRDLMDEALIVSSKKHTIINGMR